MILAFLAALALFGCFAAAYLIVRSALWLSANMLGDKPDAEYDEL